MSLNALFQDPLTTQCLVVGLGIYIFLTKGNKGSSGSGSSGSNGSKNVPAPAGNSQEGNSGGIPKWVWVVGAIGLVVYLNGGDLPSF